MLPTSLLTVWININQLHQGASARARQGLLWGLLVAGAVVGVCGCCKESPEAPLGGQQPVPCQARTGAFPPSCPMLSPRWDSGWGAVLGAELEGGWGFPVSSLLRCTQGEAGACAVYFMPRACWTPPLPGSCLGQGVLLHFYPWGKELLGGPVVGTLLRGGTSAPGQGATSAARALAGFALTASPLRAHLRKGNLLAVTH